MWCHLSLALALNTVDSSSNETGSSAWTLRLLPVFLGLIAFFSLVLLLSNKEKWRMRLNKSLIQNFHIPIFGTHKFRTHESWKLAACSTVNELIMISQQNVPYGTHRTHRAWGSYECFLLLWWVPVYVVMGPLCFKCNRPFVFVKNRDEDEI